MTETKRSTPDKRQGQLPATADPLGPTVLLAGEDQADYDRLAAQITAAVRPQDIIEAIWVRDVVDLVWEIMRLKRLKVSFLRSCALEGVEAVLDGLVAYGEAGTLAREWHRGSATAIATVDALLAAAGLTFEAATALTFAGRLDEVERIERMIDRAESRKNTALRELDRHRAALAERLRRAMEEVQDAEFSEVPAVEEPQLKHASDEDERLGWYPGENGERVKRYAS